MGRILDINDPLVEWRLQTRLCHISTLPSELLLEVFHLLTFDVRAPNVVPATLSHVSMLWRDLVLHAAELWTKVLVVEDLGPDVVAFRKTIDRVQFFLSQSAAHALDMHIELRTYYDNYVMENAEHPFYNTIDQFRECARSISKSLAPHIWRIKSFYLDCDEFKSISDIQGSFQVVPMKMLEVLRVRQAFEEQSFENFLDDDTEGAAILVPLGSRCVEEDMYPRLRSAVLATIPLDWGRFCPKNLHTLEISFFSMEARPDGKTLRQILLANEHSLESLTIHGASPVDRVMAPYVMSKLRHLDLGYAYPSELVHLVECMRVPNLTTLHIIDLRRSLSCATERRYLHYSHATSILFQAIINELPLHQVERLELRHISLMPEVGLLPWYPEVQIVPNLSHLPIPITALDFLCRLTGLESLTIASPDPGILHALNYLPPPIKPCGLFNDSQFTHVPVPALKSLHLMDFNLPLVRFFLAIRRSRCYCFRRLHSLTFGMPATWMLNFDLLLFLAHGVERFDTILEPCMEKDLITPLY